jgi:transcriptional regulator with XRE-family HTH domain
MTHTLTVISHDTERHGHLAPMAKGKALTIGERIVRAREAAGYGQAEMARLLNVSTSTAFRWEHDEVEVPVERLRAIAELCQVPVGDLIPENEPGSGPLSGVDAVADDPIAHIQLAQLALAAAGGDEDAKRKLNETVMRRAKWLQSGGRKSDDEDDEDS